VYISENEKVKIERVSILPPMIHQICKICL
jgi:hypothetical protein